MSKLTDDLCSIGVVNDHYFFAAGQAHIQYLPDEAGSAGLSCAKVYRRGFNTATYGEKTYYGWEAPRPEGVSPRTHCIALAQEWASERYGIREWKRSPFGGYGDAYVVKQRTAHFKALIRDAQRERVV